MKALRRLVLGAGLLASWSSWAQVLPPLTQLRVTPNPANPGQAIEAVLEGSCVTVSADHQVTVQGSNVTLTHQVDDVCGDPPPPVREFSYLLGSFAPGTYELVYAPTSPVPGITYNTQSTTFIVAGPQPAAIPAAAWHVLLILTGLILVVGSRHSATR